LIKLRLPDVIKQLVLDYTGCFFQWNDFGKIFKNIMAVMNYLYEPPNFQEQVYVGEDTLDDDTKQCCIADYFYYAACDYIFAVDDGERLTCIEKRLDTHIYAINGTCSYRDILNVVANCERFTQLHSQHMYLEGMRQYHDGVWFSVFGT
jgi:hypothetical protein